MSDFFRRFACGLRRLHRVAQGLLPLLCILGLHVLFVGTSLASAKDEAQPALSTSTNWQHPLVEHPAWKRLDELAPKMSLVWSRRYLELKAIAEDVDTYSKTLPPQLNHLRRVINETQENAIPLMLDLVPSRLNVHECRYTIDLLQQWYWKLEEPLHESASSVSTLDHYYPLLDRIKTSLDELKIQEGLDPIFIKASQDLLVLHDLVNERSIKLRSQIREVRYTAINLFLQMKERIVESEKNFPAQWYDYYTKPFTITKQSFYRLGDEAYSMYTYIKNDFQSSAAFAIILNIAIITLLLLVRYILRPLASSQTPPSASRSFLVNLATVVYSFDKGHRWALGLAILVTLNSLADSVPQIHVFIPFIYVQHMMLTVALAFWSRTSHRAPAVWELALPPIVGQLLLHGDGSAILWFVGMGGALLVPMFSLIYTCRTTPSKARFIWIGMLLGGFVMTTLGYGRLVPPLFMLYLAVSASLVIVQRIRTHPALAHNHKARPLFIMVVSLALSIISIYFVLSCSGLKSLFSHWQRHPLPLGGVNIYANDVILVLFLFLALLALSMLAKQSVHTLALRGQVLDVSAVPVLSSVANAMLWSFFFIFVLHHMGADISSLAFIGGGLTVGIGIAAKTILSNFFCGLVIIFSRAVRANDLVELNNIRGRVLNVNMRATMVQTLSNGILLIPNEDMLKSHLTNWTLNNNNAREDVPISVCFESHLDTVLAALNEAPSGLYGILETPPPKALFVGFGENSMNCILQVWVADVNERNSILSTLRQRICRIFAVRGIKLSSPRLSVTMDQ